MYPLSTDRIHHGFHSSLLKKLARIPIVSIPDYRLVAGLKNGDAHSSFLLFAKHYKYILAKIIQITKGRWYSDDLLQAGAVGIYEAAKRWDEKKNIKFLTYAHYYILKCLYLEARNEMLPLGGLGIGRDAKERLYNYIKFKMLGFTDAEIKDKLHCSTQALEHLSTLNSFASHICSLDSYAAARQQGKPDEEAYDRQGTPASESAEDEFMDLDFVKYVSKVVQGLTKDHPRIAKVINLELGLNGCVPSTKKEIAEQMHTTIREVTELRRDGNVLLRKQLLKDGYYDQEG